MLENCSNDLNCIESKTIVSVVWNALTDKEQREKITDDHIAVFKTWPALSELIKQTKDFNTINRNACEDILNFLKERAKCVIEIEFPENNKIDDLNRYKSVAWIHLYGFIRQNWPEVKPQGDTDNTICITGLNAETHISLLEQARSAGYKDEKLKKNKILQFVTILKNACDKDEEKTRKVFSEEINWGTEKKIALLLHHLCLLLTHYQSTDMPYVRSNLCKILPNVLRRFFDNMDSAWAYLEHFFQGKQDEFPFHGVKYLYKHLCKVKKFKEDFANNKGKLIWDLRQTLELSKENEKKKKKTEEIASELNKKLHGNRVEEKLTNVSQLTGFVRSSSTIKGKKEYKNYTNYFTEEGFDLLTFIFKKSENKWIKLEVDESDEGKKNKERYEKFLFYLDQNYKTHGHSLRSLQNTFSSPRKDQKDPTSAKLTKEQAMDGAIWIADGEITFYLILTILAKIKEQEGPIENWITGNGWKNIILRWKAAFPFEENLEFIEKEFDDHIKSRKMSIQDPEKFKTILEISEFNKFFTKEWILFKEDKDAGDSPKPTDKFWSLYNFLERVDIGRVEPFAGHKDINKFAKILYKRLLGEGKDSSSLFYRFENIFLTLDQEFIEIEKEKVKNELHDIYANPQHDFWHMNDIQNSSRLSTFAIEVILRRTEDSPRTLFFFPTAFDRVVLGKDTYYPPTAFLAGTFMNIEMTKFPFVNTMLNSNLWPLLEFLRPLLDHFLSLQLQTDEKEIKTKNDEVKKHSTKTAIVSIMSRNLSHNIGSHVLSYWDSELEECLKKSSSEEYDPKKNEVIVKKSKDLFQYIQNRMDFIAEVSTSVPCSEMSLDIERDILNPVFKESDDEKLKGINDFSVLLKYIAHSEKIELHGKVNIEVQPKRASIPNGLIGTHAIYSILENFIRNAAKHYKSGNAKKESDNNKEIIRIVIKEPITEAWKDQYLVMRIWDMRKNSCDPGLIGKLRAFLPGGDKYHFTKDGELVPDGWGIKEMLTSANFLRKNSPEVLLQGNREGEPPLMEILCGDDGEFDPSCLAENNRSYTDCCVSSEEKCLHKNDYQSRLGIRLYLRKPKDLAVLVDDKEGVTTGKELFEIEKIKKKDVFNKEIPHRILLVNEGDESRYEENPRMPCRIMRMPCKINDEYEINNQSRINDESYFHLYEKFIKDKIWGKNDWPPKLVYHNVDENLEFPDNTYTKSTKNKVSEELLFINHLNEIIKNNSNSIPGNIDDALYIQPVSGGYSTKNKLGKRPPEGLPEDHFFLELIESALTRVVIVDERVSEWANKEFYGNEKNRDILKKMNIKVAEVNLENIKIDNLKKKLKNNTGEKFAVLDSEKGCAHFFVIHQGILDKLGKDEAKNFMGNIKRPWKVVDSGRGVPPDLYDDVRFVEISALLKMLQNFDKHGIVQTLFSLRRPPISKGKEQTYGY